MPARVEAPRSRVGSGAPQAPLDETGAEYPDDDRIDEVWAGVCKFDREQDRGAGHIHGYGKKFCGSYQGNGSRVVGTEPGLAMATRTVEANAPSARLGAGTPPSAPTCMTARWRRPSARANPNILSQKSKRVR